MPVFAGLAIGALLVTLASGPGVGRLYAGDASAEGSVSFDPEPQGVPVVPEPTNGALALFGGILLFVLAFRRARRAA